ncbi:unnamed protein product [Meganyctiphanes norvegica]|uniref:C-type lectin domain-containing protein n=1 Tax=Meganyctiphanes norvegica TaxID=48144 RepID=A0AAV2Q5T9_MEGNR
MKWFQDITSFFIVMSLTSFTKSDCPPGYSYYSSHCFRVYEPGSPLRTWEAALQECISSGGDLPMVDSWRKTMGYIITNYAPRIEGSVPSFWVGVKIDTADEWSSPKWLNGMTFMGPWAPGQPKHVAPPECLAVVPTSMNFQVLSCHQQTTLACQAPLMPVAIHTHHQAGEIEEKETLPEFQVVHIVLGAMVAVLLLLILGLTAYIFRHKLLAHGTSLRIPFLSLTKMPNVENHH